MIRKELRYVYVTDDDSEFKIESEAIRYETVTKLEHMLSKSDIYFRDTTEHDLAYWMLENRVELLKILEIEK